MNYWIFQGNPKQFDVDTYLTNQENVTWGIRQKQFTKDMKIGDPVFIWRSNGTLKDSGGIIAKCEIVSEPFQEEGFEEVKVKLKVIDVRLSAEEGMLMRHELKEIPQLMNLLIFKWANNTNYRISKEEYKSILTFWESPEELKKQQEFSLLHKYLLLFKEESEHLFKQGSFLKENHLFFQNFKKKEHLSQLEWKDVQEIGKHVNSFRMGLARKRALGNPNAEMEQYRKSFQYLIYGEDELAVRIDQFLLNDSYRLFGFGDSVVSELVGNFFPEEYSFYNQRSKVAVENILGFTPAYNRGDSNGQRFIKFQHCLQNNQIVDTYLQVVGRQTDMPIFLEIDCFFSFLYENFRPKDSKSPDETRYWTISSGKDRERWTEFQQQNRVAINWSELGDLSQYSSKQEISKAYKEIHGGSARNDVLANFEFAHEMSIGDTIFVFRGQHTLLGLGKISSDYKYDGDREEYGSYREVEWQQLGEWTMENSDWFSKTLTDITNYPEFVEKLFETVRAEYEVKSTSVATVHEPLEVYSQEELWRDVFIEEEQLNDMLESLDYKKNIILQGPPGVGKTFVAKRLAYAHNERKDDSKIEMVQFHQSYSYEEFIRGYKPMKEGAFALKDGIFYTFCQKASKDLENNYYFIIDEINRGNMAKIFGELMMLIEHDKRGKEYSIALAYSEGNERFYIPENVYIIGTMNTADRSLALVDYALRRRFSFISITPAFHTGQFRELLKTKGISNGFIKYIITSLTDINNEIVKDTLNLGKGYEIGHSYFCPSQQIVDEKKWFQRVVKLEIEPLLREYWFDNEGKVNELLGQLY